MSPYLSGRSATPKLHSLQFIPLKYSSKYTLRLVWEWTSTTLLGAPFVLLLGYARWVRTHVTEYSTEVVNVVSRVVYEVVKTVVLSVIVTG